MRRAAAALALLAAPTAAALASAPNATAPRAPQPLVDRPPAATAPAFPDPVLPEQGLRADQRLKVSVRPARRYRTPDGVAISVRFSRGYREDPSVAQSYVDFLGRLPHGGELAQLKLVLATPAEVRDACGAHDALACYGPRSHTMIVPGQQVRAPGGITTSYVMAHEYGHHVAAYRSNFPFSSVDWGPKRWSSYELVCLGVLHRKLAPGDEGRFYAYNPGEAWAETYAHLVYPRLRWRFTPRLRPDAGALSAALADVHRPWRHGATRTFGGGFGRGLGGVRRFAFELTLDGRIEIRLHGPRRANYDLILRSLGTTRLRTRGHGAQDAVVYRGVCRERLRERISVTVVRRSGRGPFSLTVRYPG